MYVGIYTDWDFLHRYMKAKFSESESGAKGGIFLFN